ncbi:MAG: hypothetical protein SOY64_01515 [Pyramidobacter sp.]|uniref:DUF997 family protein n=1 Tax=Pyramidobacter sp. TaxID=1943581 RepID=UPI002A7F756A|nr:DUF997 family protein [Pyramidobacter sp.]MDY4031732.1 hypothetical protein [Pyramidobacter sp.]
MDSQNLESTAYDVSKITNYDRRLEAGKRDAIFFHGIGFIATVIATVIMFIYGSGDPKDMPFLFGMPMWWSAGVLIYLVMYVIGNLYLICSPTYSLAARENDKGGSKE